MMETLGKLGKNGDQTVWRRFRFGRWCVRNNSSNHWMRKLVTLGKQMAANLAEGQFANYSYEDDALHAVRCIKRIILAWELETEGDELEEEARFKMYQKMWLTAKWRQECSTEPPHVTRLRVTYDSISPVYTSKVWGVNYLELLKMHLEKACQAVIH